MKETKSESPVSWTTIALILALFIIIMLLFRGLGLTEPLGAAICTGMITCFTVSLTLSTGQRQFTERLVREDERIAEARRFEAKKQAFIDAQRATLGFIGHITAMPMAEMPTDGKQPEEIRDFGTAITTLHFYSELSTIELAIRLQTKLLSAYLDVFDAKTPSIGSGLALRATRRTIAILEEKEADIRDEILEARKERKDYAIPNISATLKLVIDELRPIRLREAEESITFERHKLECSKVASTKIINCYPEITGLLVCARKEIGFPIEETRYHELITEQNAIMTTKIRKIYAGADALFAPGQSGAEVAEL